MLHGAHPEPNPPLGGAGQRTWLMEINNKNPVNPVTNPAIKQIEMGN
jgi:hypothetical protein